MTAGEDGLRFGPFRLLPGQQLLLEGDRHVPIGARAFELLLTLANRAGEVISNNELNRLVWGGLTVEESNVRVHIAGLRRVLRDGEAGARYVINVPGRGYSFVAPVTRLGEQSSGLALIQPETPKAGLPRSVAKIVGRTGLIETLCSQMAQRRFLTLVGPGGIGKTTVAVAVARELSASYPDGVCFVDMSSIRDPELLSTTVAAALGLSVPVRDATSAIIAHIGRKHMLLVLDNCEHVIETAANAAEHISSSAPGVHIIATSREPLRAAGERVHRLSPLESPVRSAGLTAAEALSFPSVQLFMDRLSATMDDAEISDADAPLVAEICRRLDGIALAIELAAGRVAAFGLQELAARLDDRFRLLTTGRRTAISRHQTLSATLDWSYQLLPEAEQALARRLSIFPGDFSPEDATGIVGAGAAEVLELVADLVAKSLITSNPGPDGARFRMLETTRLYCAEKLRDAGEYAETARAHADRVLAVLPMAEAETALLPSQVWRTKYATLLANVRAALGHAELQGGGDELFVALTTAAVPVWVQWSYMEECRCRVERALPMVGGTTRSDMLARMRLTAALGWSLMYVAGRSEEIGAAWAATLELAEGLDDTSHQLRALWGIWMGKLNRGELEAALDLATRMLELAQRSSDRADLVMADRLMGTTLHYRGDQDDARYFLDRMFKRNAESRSSPNTTRFQVDQKVTAQYFLARVLWLQGHVDQSQDLVLQNMRDGEALGHALSFASVLGQSACPIALLTGDIAGARRYATMLLEHSERHGLLLWRDWARCFGGLVAIREGEFGAGLTIMRDVFDQAGDSRYLPRYMLLLGEYAGCPGPAKPPAQDLATVDEMLARCNRTQERWYEPELHRFRGELLARSDPPAAAERVEAHFLQAISLATSQGARSWQLRAAMSLAQFRRSREPLATIHASFTEGFATADLRRASELLSNPA